MPERTKVPLLENVALKCLGLGAVGCDGGILAVDLRRHDAPNRLAAAGQRGQEPQSPRRVRIGEEGGNPRRSPQRLPRLSDESRRRRAPDSPPGKRTAIVNGERSDGHQWAPQTATA